MLEALEHRLAPASLAQSGSTLTITLNTANEQLTLAAAAGGTIGLTSTGTFSGSVNNPASFSGFTALSGTLTPTGLATIDIQDTSGIHGGSVVFADSGANSYSQAFVVNLVDSESANVAFIGTNNFTGNLSASSSGGMVVSESTTASLTVGGNLTLVSSLSRNLEFLGKLAVTGSTNLTGYNITANNSSNSFGGDVNFTAVTQINLVSGGSLELGSDNLTFTSSNGSTSLIEAKNDITQDNRFISGDGSDDVIDFVSTSGNIVLSNTGNSINDTPIGLSVTGAGNATLFNKLFTELANVSTGTGTLTITSQGSINQYFGNSTITTGGPAVFNIDTSTEGISLSNLGDLNSPGNNFGGTVTFGETNGGIIDQVSYRNISTHASIPTFSPTNIQALNYTLRLDNAPVVLPATTVTGTLTITAGGSITQTGAITAVTAAFSVLGNYGINLNNSANAISGAVSFFTSSLGNGTTLSSSQPVVFVNSGPVTLGISKLGRGAFSITSTSGGISSASSSFNTITQQAAAATATFTAGGASVTLGNANDFTGNIVIVGGSVNSITIDNADPLANQTSLTLPTGFSGALTITYNNAPYVLSSALSPVALNSLNITAQGIFETSSPSAGSMNVSGQATFSAGAFPIVLTGSNQFANITVGNLGRNDVAIYNVSSGATPLTFSGTSSLGSGRLVVFSTNGISDTSPGAILQAANAGPITLSSTSGSINLSGNNSFTGAISASSNSGAGNVTLTNSSTSTVSNLILGNNATTTGVFTATAAQGSIVQAAGTKLTLAGASVFTGNAGITLANPGNTFSTTASVGLTTTAGPAVISSSGPLVLGNITLGSNNLTVSTSGTLSQATGTAITDGSEASFSSGTGNITLTNANNSFSAIDLFSTGSAVSVTTLHNLIVNQVALGNGTLTLQVNGNLSQSSGSAVTQSGTTPGAITLTDAGSGTLTLGNNDSLSTVVSPNFLAGAITASGFTSINLATASNLTLAALPASVAGLVLTAGGSLVLPSSALSVGSLNVSAKSTQIGSNITVSTGPITFTGAVTFTAPVTIDAHAATSTGDVTIAGNVTAQAALTFNLASARRRDSEQRCVEPGSKRAVLHERQHNHRSPGDRIRRYLRHHQHGLGQQRHHHDGRRHGGRFRYVQGRDAGRRNSTRALQQRCWHSHVRARLNDGGRSGGHGQRGTVEAGRR